MCPVWSFHFNGEGKTRIPIAKSQWKYAGMAQMVDPLKANGSMEAEDNVYA